MRLGLRRSTGTDGRHMPGVPMKPLVDAFREIMTEEVEEMVEDVRMRMGFSIDRLILLGLIMGSMASVVGHQVLRWRYRP